MTDSVFDNSLNEKWTQDAKRDNVLGYLVLHSGIPMVTFHLEEILTNPKSKGSLHYILEELLSRYDDEAMPPALNCIVMNNSENAPNLLHATIFARCRKLEKLDTLVSKLLETQLHLNDSAASINQTNNGTVCTPLTCESWLDGVYGGKSSNISRQISPQDTSRTRAKSCEIPLSTAALFSDAGVGVLREHNTTESRELSKKIEKKYSLSSFDPFCPNSRCQNSTSNACDEKENSISVIGLSILPPDDWTDFGTEVLDSPINKSGRSDLICFSPTRNSFRQHFSAPPSPAGGRSSGSFSNMRA